MNKRFRALRGIVSFRSILTLLLGSALLIGAPLSTMAEANTVSTKQEIIDLVVNYHVSGVEMNELDVSSIDTIIASLKDPYTQYFSTEEWQVFMDSLENNYTGIGIRVGADDYGFYVVEVFESTPAAEAGLQEGDYIVAVEGQPTKGKTVEELVSSITGIEGTQVNLTTERDERQTEHTLTRRAIHISAITSRYLESGIGYIRISSFSSDADELFSAELDRLHDQGMNSLVIDLRDNPGGLLDSAGNIASRLLTEGNLIHTRDRSQTETPYPIHSDNPIDIPIYALVNEHSASASEVLAGALQDYDAAQLIGKNTYGKGSVQSLFQLTDGSVLKLTVQEYLTPHKHPVNKVGLKPDVEVYGNAAQLITAFQQVEDLDVSVELTSKGMSINGASFTDSFQVLREDGRVYVPSRVLAAIVESSTDWDSASRSVMIHAAQRQALYPVDGEHVKLTRGVSYIALDHFQHMFDAFAWSDASGVLTLIENGR